MTRHWRGPTMAATLLLSLSFLTIPAGADEADPIAELNTRLDAAVVLESELPETYMKTRYHRYLEVVGTALREDYTESTHSWRNANGEWGELTTYRRTSTHEPGESKTSAQGWSCTAKCGTSKARFSGWIDDPYQGRGLRGRLTGEQSKSTLYNAWGAPGTLPSDVARNILSNLVLDDKDIQVTESTLSDGTTRTLVTSTTYWGGKSALELIWQGGRVMTATRTVSEEDGATRAETTSTYEATDFSEHRPANPNVAQMPLFSDVVDQRLKKQTEVLADNLLKELTKKAHKANTTITYAWVERHLDAALSRASQKLPNPGFANTTAVHPRSTLGTPVVGNVAVAEFITNWPRDIATAPPAYAVTLRIGPDGRLNVRSIEPDDTYVPDPAPETPGTPEEPLPVAAPAQNTRGESR